MKEFAFEPKSCWKVYKDDAATMHDFAKNYIKFLSNNKTERETTDYAVEVLKKAGFSEDFNNDKIMRPFCGKSLFAARKGKKALADGFHLISSHTDSPRLDFKQHPLLEQAAVGQAKTHYYGGIRKYQWLARPLALHGVVVKEDGTVVKINIGDDANDPVFTIEDLLPHLAQKQATQTIADAFPAERLNIILGHQPVLADSEEDEKDLPKDAVKAHIIKILNDKYGIKEEDLYSAEMQAVPAGDARFIGFDEALIGGYAHDDRVCVYTSLHAFIEAKDLEHTAVLILWDKEEIGSEGSTGARSKFLEYCVEDMVEAWEPQTKLRNVMLNSKAISADVHAGLDPDFQDVHEKLNASVLGYGPCMCKFTGSRGKSGANDAHPEYVAWLRKIFNERNIPWQMAELGKVDLGGGGTVALHLAAHGMNVIDMGPSVLSMHSPFEIVSKADLYATKLAYLAFFEGK